MSKLVLRDATVADLPASLAMLAEAVIPPGREADPSDPRYLAAFEAIDADPNQRLIAAELGGRVVGTMQLSFLPGLSCGRSSNAARATANSSSSHRRRAAPPRTAFTRGSASSKAMSA